MFGPEQRLVALNVHVNLGRMALRYGVDPIGAAGQVRGGQLDRPSMCLAEIHHLARIGCHEQTI